MRSTLVVAGTYAGVALAAPNVAAVQNSQAAQAVSAGWPWDNIKPQANNRPKNGQGSYSGYSGGLVNTYNPKPQSLGSRPSGSGGIWSMFRGNGGSSSGSSFGGLGGFGSSSGSSDRKGGFGPWSPAKPEAAAPKSPVTWGAPASPAAPVAWGAPAAPAAPAAAEAPEAVEMPANAEIPADAGTSAGAENAEEQGAPEMPAAVEAPIPKHAPKPPKLIPSAPSTTRHQQLWQPKVAAPFQIVLSGTVDSSVQLAPDFVEIFDIDLFNTPKSSIQALRKQNKKVICYFSAGSSENWREDFKRFKSADMGKGVAKDDKGGSYWEGEKWLNLRSQNVWNIMRDRIKLAADKGCHAVDPDNMDFFNNQNTGVKGTQDDSVNFMRMMAEESAKYNMSIGLKNSMDILPKVQSFIQFAVNEECAAMGECHEYKDFLKTKPVFHIEYTKTKSGGTTIGTDKEYGKAPSTLNSGLSWLFGARKPSKRDTIAVDASASQACSIKTAPDLGPKFSTVIKVEDLDGWVKFCDGRTSTTRTVGSAKSRYSGNSEDSSESEESASSGKLSSFGNFGSFGKSGEAANSRGSRESQETSKSSSFGNWANFGGSGAAQNLQQSQQASKPSNFGNWGNFGGSGAAQNSRGSQQSQEASKSSSFGSFSNLGQPAKQVADDADD